MLASQSSMTILQVSPLAVSISRMTTLTDRTGWRSHAPRGSRSSFAGLSGPDLANDKSMSCFTNKLPFHPTRFRDEVVVRCFRDRQQDSNGEFAAYLGRSELSLAMRVNPYELSIHMASGETQQGHIRDGLQEWGGKADQNSPLHQDAPCT